MRILWVATKNPWPPVDGGRLVQQLTLEALAGAGAEITVVAPVPAGVEAVGPTAAGSSIRLQPVPSPPRSPLARGFALAPWGPPATIRLHRRPEVAARVDRLLGEGGFDLVHAEQLQALAQTEPARRRGLPVVLRAQNVESDLWRATADLGGALGPLAAVEARRLGRWEARRIEEVDLTVALTERDAARLGRLGGRVVAVPPPFPPVLPYGSVPLEGRPAVVVFGAGGWRPNRDAVRWFVRRVWPLVESRLPEAVLHLFGAGGSIPRVASIRRHEAPASSADVFAHGAIHAVPLRVASGIRMKILESWARGVPVVATPPAAAGLGAERGRELLVADDAEGFAESIARLQRGGDQARRRLIEAGREALRERHDPRSRARRLLEVYQLVLRSPQGPAAGGG